MKGSIIIPAHNEAKRIVQTLASISRYLKAEHKHPSDWEVIVVCDGCLDDTEAVVRAYAERLPLRVIAYANNRGKGYAVRKGVLASRGELVAFMDADGSTPIQELTRLATPILENRADFVAGSRHTADAAVALRQSLPRRILGRAFAHHARMVLGLRVHDTQCGFKVFHGPTARQLFARLRCEGFAFDLELFVLARAQHARVLECGVTWRESPGSTVHPVRDGLRMLADAWRIRARSKGDLCAPTVFPSPIPAADLHGMECLT